jgi:acetylglutamate kinase
VAAEPPAAAAGATVVVKLGGEVVGDARLAAIAADLRALVDEGARVVVVHGGGPQVTRLSERLGLPPRIVAGRRITDEATLQAVKMAIAGEVNVELCAALRAAGLRPVGLHGALAAVRRPPRVITGGGPEPIDLGWVGDVVGFDRPLCELLLTAGYTPVLACLGSGADGEVFNINADIVGNQVAMALGADPLVLVTSAPGVLADPKDPGSRLARLTVAEARAAIADGTVSGGMIPKLEESFAALAGGVQRIVICDGAVARAVRHPGEVGTTLSR